MSIWAKAGEQGCPKSGFILNGVILRSKNKRSLIGFLVRSRSSTPNSMRRRSTTIHGGRYVMISRLPTSSFVRPVVTGVAR